MHKAPVWKHFAAFLYDLFPILGIFLLTSFVVVLARNGNSVEPHTFWFDLLLFLELALYFVYSWKVGGQTLGMRAWKMKVIPNNKSLNTITWKQSILRLFIGVTSTLLLGAGLFWKLFSSTQITWMDSVSDSDTLVEL